MMAGASRRVLLPWKKKIRFYFFLSFFHTSFFFFWWWWCSVWHTWPSFSIVFLLSNMAVCIAQGASGHPTAFKIAFFFFFFFFFGLFPSLSTSFLLLPCIRILPRLARPPVSSALCDRLYIYVESSLVFSLYYTITTAAAKEEEEEGKGGAKENI